MNIYELLPTRKVTAYLLGAALALVALWLLVDVFAVLDEWPPAFIVGAITIVVGFILAWIVPESAWRKSAAHADAMD